MNKRKRLIILTVVMIVAIPCFVFAATSEDTAAKTVRSFFGFDPSKLTEQQQADVTEYSQKMADLGKEFINRMIANGAITQEQGDAAIKRLDGMQENGVADRFLFGFEGRVKKAAPGLGQIDLSKLTDQQKSDLTETHKKMAQLQKEHIAKLAADGLITEAQASQATERIDELLKDIEEKGISSDIKMYLGGFAVRGAKASSLTDQQKADLEAFSKSMAELQKEYIGKIVSYGLITQEQGDAMIKRLDNMENFRSENGFRKAIKKPEIKAPAASTPDM